MSNSLSRTSNSLDSASADVLLKEFAAHASQVLLLIDAVEGKILYVSPSYEQLWGRTRQSLIDNPRSYMEGIHPLDRDRMAEMDAAMYRTGHIDTEFRVLRPDGSIRWVSISGSSIVQQGRIVRLTGELQDITSERSVVAERDELLARLQLQRERMPLAYILFDNEFRIIDWNLAAERIFGYTKSEALGLHALALVPETFHRQGLELLRRIRSGDVDAHSTNSNLTKQQQVITCEWVNFPLMSSALEFKGLLCLARDVTEQRLMQEQLYQTQKMDALGQLAAGVAHDFNNLLTIIAGYTDIILSTLPAEDSLREFVEAIGDAGERAASLTRQLLLFSRKTALEPKIVDVNGVVRETENLLRRVIGEDVVLSTVLDSRIGTTRIDPGLLGQVIMNLAINARDAMPKGGRLTIETHSIELEPAEARCRSNIKPGRYVLLSVRDTGNGMTAELQARIFEPFFTTKEPGHGTGLGLAIVQGFVKQSNGHIEVDSAPGRGSTFKIFLPEINEVITEAETKESAGGLHGSERVLLVEDDDRVREFTRFILQTYGYSVVSASQGREALELADQYSGQIDLLVSDVVMPAMSGPELASVLQPRFPQMKVLFSSGYTDDALSRHGLAIRQSPILQKPYSPLNFLKNIRQVLDCDSRPEVLLPEEVGM